MSCSMTSADAPSGEVRDSELRCTGMTMISRRDGRTDWGFRADLLDRGA